MKWFKHHTDAHEGRSLMTLFDELGHAGPNCYWILLELCAAKLEKKPDEDLTKADCKFNFHLRKVRERFRLSSTKVESWFNLASTLGLLTFQISEREIEISFPQIIEILESDQKKSRAKSVSAPPETRLEEDKDKEEDKELDKEEESKPPKKPALNPRVLVEVWNSDRGTFSEVLEFSDERKRKASAQLKKYPDIAHWRQVLAKFKASKFCLDEWRPTFDDWLSEAKRLKALEGKYDDRAGKGMGRGKAPPAGALQREINADQEMQQLMSEVLDDAG